MPEPAKDDAAEMLRAISKALVRRHQLQNWKKELLDKKEVLDRQIVVAEKEENQVEEVLSSAPELTSIAQELLGKGAELRGAGDDEIAIYNPGYVSSADKERLLLKMLKDYHKEHPEAEGMPFSTIKAVLKNRYKIETGSAGLFFRRELKNWDTAGGTKNKMVLLDLQKLSERVPKEVP